MEDKESSDSAEVDSGQSNSEEKIPYRCEYCGTTFRKHAKYIRHLRTHTKEVRVAVFVRFRNHFHVRFRVVGRYLAAKTT